MNHINNFDFLLGKSFEQGKMMLDNTNYNLRPYSIDRIIPLGTVPSGFNPNRINIRIKKEKIFEVLGRF